MFYCVFVFFIVVDIINSCLWLDRGILIKQSNSGQEYLDKNLQINNKVVVKNVYTFEKFLVCFTVSCWKSKQIETHVYKDMSHLLLLSEQSLQYSMILLVDCLVTKFSE